MLTNFTIKFVFFFFNLELENYNDKNKLSANVFEDFEKQTAWQSFTTLLITDIVSDNNEDKNGGTFSKTVTGGALAMKKNETKLG